MPLKKILLIDDEIEIRDFMQQYLEDRGYEVITASDGLEGIEKFKLTSYDLVLCDMMMPKLIGLEVLRRIRETNPDQKIIMLTGVKESSMVSRAMELGCRFYLNKPFSLADVAKKIEDCFTDVPQKDA